LPGINFLSHDYWYPDALVDGVIDANYGDPLIEDHQTDALDGIAALDLTGLYVTANAETVQLAATIAGDIYSDYGNYLIYFDTTHDTQGADVDAGRRPITVADPFKPEYSLDISVREERGTVSGSYTLNAWTDSGWEQIMFTGGGAILAGETSVIELQIPRALLGSPQTLNIAMISTDRARAHTEGNILGTDFTPSDWSETLILDTFFEVSLP
jgi:hypothetical protein